jgi:hypothetical protein
MTIRAKDLVELSRLFDHLLTLDASARDDWLENLPQSQRHLAPGLRAMRSRREHVADASRRDA